jgi:hypothetical protein
MNFYTYHSYVIPSMLFTGGGSRGQPRKKRARKVKETQEVVKPTKQTQRQKSVAMEKWAFAPLNKLSEAEFARPHQINPYLNDHNPTWAYSHF